MAFWLNPVLLTLYELQQKSPLDVSWNDHPANLHLLSETILQNPNLLRWANNKFKHAKYIFILLIHNLFNDIVKQIRLYTI